MKKKLTALSTIIMLGLGSAFAIPSVKAASNTNSQSIKDQRSGIKAGISKADAEISKVQGDLARLTEQTNRVDQAINDNESMISQTEEKMKESKSEVKKLQQEVSMIKDRIAKRNEVLKKRALSFQESGGSTSYLDVLLGASSFGDFVDRIGAVTSLVEADQELVKQHEADKKEVEIKQNSVEQKLANLKSMKTELVGMHDQILEQKKQNDELKIELKKVEKEKITNKSNLLEKDRNLALKALQLEQSNEVQPATGSSSSSNNGGTSSNSNSNSNSNHSANTSNSTESTPVSNGSVQDVISAGYKYIGNSVYVFGGGRTASDVANGRFDCSGFVHWAFTQAGYNIGSSTDSLKYAGTQVPTSQMRPGDLVFFNTYKTDGHVGIYIGGGKFIGSQSSTGVAIASMSNSYWKPRFNGRVVRIISE